MASRNKLTEQQKQFCEHFAVLLNGTQAAIESKYSEKTAAQQASRLLSKVKIVDYIAVCIKRNMAKVELTPEKLYRECARIALNNPKNVFSEDGNILPVHEWPDDVAACISSIKVTQLGDDQDSGAVSLMKEIKFWDKGKQIDIGAKLLGLMIEKKEIKNEITIGDGLLSETDRFIEDALGGEEVFDTEGSVPE